MTSSFWTTLILLGIMVVVYGSLGYQYAKRMFEQNPDSARRIWEGGKQISPDLTVAEAEGHMDRFLWQPFFVRYQIEKLLSERGASDDATEMIHV